MTRPGPDPFNYHTLTKAERKAMQQCGCPHCLLMLGKWKPSGSTITHKDLNDALKMPGPPKFEIPAQHPIVEKFLREIPRTRAKEDTQGEG